MCFLPNVSVPRPQGVVETEPTNGKWMSLFRGREGRIRSFVKAESWRTVGTIDTFIIPRAT